jgi:hypothetical protein
VATLQRRLVINTPQGVGAVTKEIDPESLAAFNYCVCFVDILGQRHALRDQGLLPAINSEEERLRFVREVLANTIRPITRLQKETKDMMAVVHDKSASAFRKSLPPEFHAEWDKLQECNLQVQYWSDGLVLFCCLGNQGPAAQVNGAFSLLGLAGSLCFMHLCHQSHSPIRGGIDIAWGAELRPGELYGPAIARSYELESEVAQYPRIAVGSRMISFLKSHADLKPTNRSTEYSSTLAQLCLKLTMRDMDGQWMIHYLGQDFREAVSNQIHVEMYTDALRFVSDEYTRFRENGNSKLANRYFQLLNYFRTFPPKDLPNTQTA